jgi:hypothetical protein
MMRNAERNASKLIFVALASLLLGSCASLPAAFVPLWTAERFTGQIVDGNGQPIPGAILVGLWNESRSAIVDSTTMCVRVETATTDANGNYTLPKWRDQYPLLFAYKPEYRFAEWFIPPKDSRTTLQPFSGTTKERMDELLRLDGRTSCIAAADTGTKENLLPLRRATYGEGRDIARTNDDYGALNHLLFKVEEIELGYRAAEDRQVEREKARRGK